MLHVHGVTEKNILLREMLYVNVGEWTEIYVSMLNRWYSENIGVLLCRSRNRKVVGKHSDLFSRIPELKSKKLISSRTL